MLLRPRQGRGKPITPEILQEFKTAVTMLALAEQRPRQATLSLSLDLESPAPRQQEEAWGREVSARKHSVQKATRAGRAPCLPNSTQPRPVRRVSLAASGGDQTAGSTSAMPAGMRCAWALSSGKDE